MSQNHDFSRYVRIISCLALLAISAACGQGCGGALAPLISPSGAKPSGLLDETAVGKHRCESANLASSPFVVEWDATDLSSFEAKASRDIVFVRYEGCEIEMLYGCSDSGVPGRYGRYDSPTFTSGTVEGFTMENEDELYAKMPLGALRFGARIEVGESLELKYFVSGVVSATRSEIPRSQISDNPRCAGATHFVSAYNLGAFKLLSHKKAKGGAEVGIEIADGEASTRAASSNLKEGGLIESCETHAQTRCRVPIRLVLETIEETATSKDGDVEGVVSPAPYAPPRAAEDPLLRAHALRRSAQEKEEAGDGDGCLEDLDRALRLAPLDDNARRADMWIRAQCLMRAGRCDDGRKMMLELNMLADPDRKTDEEIHERGASAFAVAKCPVSKLRNDEEKTGRLANGVGDAAKNRDGASCLAWAKQAETLFESMKKSDERRSIGHIVEEAARCLSKAERCDEARAWAEKGARMTFEGYSTKEELKEAIRVNIESLGAACK